MDYKNLQYFITVGMYILEYMDRGYAVACLISHPYGDSSAPYLGTAILTILCFLYLYQYLSTTSILCEITSLPVEQLIKSTNNNY